jgi:hypothetical protein
MVYLKIIQSYIKLTLECINYCLFLELPLKNVLNVDFGNYFNTKPLHFSLNLNNYFSIIFYLNLYTPIILLNLYISITSSRSYFQRTSPSTIPSSSSTFSMSFPNSTSSISSNFPSLSLLFYTMP